MEQISGNNAIIELLENDPSKVERVIVEKGFKSDKIGTVIHLCRKKKVRFDVIPDLASYASKGKGCIAIIKEYRYFDLDETDWNYTDSAVILDEIEDPHNLGAIIRSAAAAGFDLVIIPERNCASVTEAVINVSAGTVYKIKIARVKNIAAAIMRLKKEGFWITGTDMKGNADYTDYDFTDRAAVVIGNESRGMRKLVKEKCDDIVRIELSNGVESLNASVAAALVLFERKKKKISLLP